MLKFPCSHYSMIITSWLDPLWYTYQVVLLLLNYVLLQYLSLIHLMLYFHPKFPIFCYHYNHPFSFEVTRYVFALSFIYSPCFKKNFSYIFYFKKYKAGLGVLIRNFN